MPRVELAMADGKTEIVYLRQSRDHVKTRPDIAVDPTRVRFEVGILDLLSSIIPDTVPKVVSFDRESNIAVLTDIRRGAPLLVNELLAGRVHPETGSEFGEKIGAIHNGTLGISDEQVRGDAKQNADAVSFHLGMRLAPSEKIYPAETEKLVADGQGAMNCLVLGDLASKNIFVEGTHVRFLDLERAFRGDPAFDPAFLFSHYLLEVPPDAIGDSIEFIARFMHSYRAALADGSTSAALASLENRIIRYLGVCILYRIDGLYLVVDAKEDKGLWRKRAAMLLSNTEGDDVIAAIREAIDG